MGNELFNLEFCDKRDPALCDNIIVQIDVSSNNTAPIVVDESNQPADTVWTQTSKNNSIDLCLTIVDNESDLTAISQLIELDGGGQASVIAGSDNCLTFTPSTDFLGASYVSATICDDGSPSMCDSVIVALDVLPAAPTAVNDSYQLRPGVLDTLAILANDLNPDGSELSVAVTVVASHGQALLLDDGELTYQADTEFVGTDSLVYRICDQGGIVAGLQCDEAVVYFQIEEDPSEPVENMAPEIVDAQGIPIDSMSVETVDQVPIEVCLLVNDSAGDTLSLAVGNTGQLEGAVSTGDDLCFLYEAPPNFDGMEWLEIIVCDNQQPALCDTVTVGIEVRRYEPPTAVDDFLYVAEDEEATLDVQENDDSPLGFALTTTLNANATLGAADVQGDWIRYQPPADFFGVDTVGYFVCDSLNLPTSCSDADVVVYVGCSDRSVLTWEDHQLSAAPNQEALRSDNIEILTSTDQPIELRTRYSNDFGSHLEWSQAGDTAGELRMAFSSAVEQLCFTIADLDVTDQSTDRVRIDGYSNGTAYGIRSYDAIIGEDIDFGESNLFSATAEPATGDFAGKVDLCFFVPIDSVVIRFDNANGSTSSDEQLLMLGDLSWCRSDAVLPEEPTTTEQLAASEGISPNGDGILDYWVIEGIENHPENVVQVFNPWGDIVFETSNYDNRDIKWDGRSNLRGRIGGAVLPDGVYLYVIRFPDREAAKGHVVLKK